jgi:hypothetical protein
LLSFGIIKLFIKYFGIIRPFIAIMLNHNRNRRENKKVGSPSKADSKMHKLN